MKTSILTVALSIAFVCSCLSQGTINFANNNDSIAFIGLSRTEPLFPLSFPAYAVLFAAPSGTPFVPMAHGMQDSDFLAANPGWSVQGSQTPILVAQPGLFNGGPVTITNTPLQGPADVAIIVYVGNYRSFDAAVAADAAIGSSLKMHFDATGTPENPVPLVQAQGLNSPVIFTIPEPAATVLAGLALALCWRRRRAV